VNIFQALLVTGEGCLLSFTVHVGVVDTLQPGPQGFVEFIQGSDIGRLHFGHKLSPQGLKKAFDFPFSLGRIRSGLDPADTQAGAGGIKLA
jgi:hypothetical protein